MNTSPLDLPHSKPNEHTHSIKTNLKFYIEEKPQNKLKSPNEKPHAKLKSPNEENSQIFSFKMDLKQKESTLQKNLQTCESPILKIAKKQKSKQLAEMMTEVQSDVKALSYNSINSIENELISPDSSPKKNYIRTPQPTKSTHKISKSTFLQHKYLENLVSKTNDLTKIDKEKNFKINLTNVPNNIINEVDPSHEETPNNINFKFKFMCHNEETSPSEINRNKYMKMNKKESEVYEHPFRHLIFSPKISENLFKKHLLITYKGITYSQRLQNPSESFLKSRAINLPESS